MNAITPLRTTLFVLLLVLFGLLAGLGGYYAGGRSDAIDDARPLARLADRLIRNGRGGEDLGEGREDILQLTQGSQLTQSLAARLAFEQFRPGIARIRQLGYMSGLDSELSRPSLTALWLETVEMGRGPNGWMKGFYEASFDLYHRPPAQLSDNEFLHLVALSEGPSRVTTTLSNPALDLRVARLRQLIARHCQAAQRSQSHPAFCSQT